MADTTFDISTVRPASSGWEPFVELFADYRAHYGQQREQQRCDRWLREQVDAGRFCCYLACASEGEPAGIATVAVSPASLSLSVFWALRDLFVAPVHRRVGVGRLLVARVAADAQAAGAVRVELQTEVDNHAALAVYRDAGFEEVTGLTTLLLPLQTSDEDG